MGMRERHLSHSNVHPVNLIHRQVELWSPGSLANHAQKVSQAVKYRNVPSTGPLDASGPALWSC